MYVRAEIEIDPREKILLQHQGRQQCRTDGPRREFRRAGRRRSLRHDATHRAARRAGRHGGRHFHDHFHHAVVGELGHEPRPPERHRRLSIRHRHVRRRHADRQLDGPCLCIEGDASGLSLTVGKTYYFSVRAKNGKGLIGKATISKGQTVVQGG